MHTLCAGDAVRHGVTVHTLCAGDVVKMHGYCRHMPVHFVRVSKAPSQKFREDILKSCLCPDFVQTCSETLNISCFLLLLFNLQKQQTATKNWYGGASSSSSSSSSHHVI